MAHSRLRGGAEIPLKHGKPCVKYRAFATIWNELRPDEGAIGGHKAIP
jgi:hypothetical protein